MKRTKCRVCLRTIDGETVYESFSTPGCCRLCDLFADAAGAVDQRGAPWGTHSEAMAVRRDQIDKAVEKDRKIGAPAVEYDKIGRPVFASRAQRHQYLRAHSKHDGVTYGDLNSFTGN